MNALLGAPPNRPAATAAPTLVLQPMWQPTLSPRLLAAGRVQIGAGADCDLRVSHPGVAEQHAMVLAGSQRVILRAWDARTWVNDTPVQETTLRAGDRIAIGPVQFRVRTATADEILEQLPATEPSTPIHPDAVREPENESVESAETAPPPILIETYEEVLRPDSQLVGEWFSAPTHWPTFESIAESTPWIAQEPLTHKPEARHSEREEEPQPQQAVIDVEAIVAERLQQHQLAWEVERQAWDQQRAEWNAQATAQDRQLDSRAQDLSRQTEQLAQRQESLARQQAEQAAQAERLGQMQSQWRQQQSELRNLRDQLQAERERLEAVVVQARTELAAEAERQTAAWQDWEATQQRLTAELADQFAAVDARRAELTNRANELEGQQTSLSVAKSEVDADRTSLAALRSEFDAERSQWNEVRRSADAEIKELRADLQRQHAQLLADMHRRAQAETDLLAARHELQQDRRQFAELHTEWLKERETLWEQLSQRRRQLEDDFAALERQHRQVGQLVAAIESELSAVRTERDGLNQERERAAADQTELSALRARGDEQRKTVEADVLVRQANLLRQSTELARQLEQCETTQGELAAEQKRLECDREQFLREQVAWQQERATRDQALTSQREQLAAQVRAAEAHREVIAGLEASLQHEVTITVLEREQLQAERERMRQEQPLASSLESQSFLTTLEATDALIRPATSADHTSPLCIPEEDLPGLDALWDKKSRAPSADPSPIDRAAASDEDAAWHDEFSDWGQLSDAAPTAQHELTMPGQVAGGESREVIGDSLAPSHQPPSHDHATTDHLQPVDDVNLPNEWSAITDLQRKAAASASNQSEHEALAASTGSAPFDVIPAEGSGAAAAGADKSIVDSVNSLRSELARLFNLPEDFAENPEPATPPAAEVPKETPEPTVADLVANIQDDEDAYAVAAPAETAPGEVEDWRSRLLSLVNQEMPEPTPLPPLEVIEPPPPPVEEARPKAGSEDSVADYMERLLARTRRSDVDRKDISQRSKSELTGSEYAIELPSETYARAAESDAPVAEPDDGDSEDYSHLHTAPRHQQDKHAARANLQSFREVANLSARNALAKHGWRVVRTEVAMHGFLTLAAVGGAAAFCYAPLWHGAVNWDRSLACVIAAGWSFRRCIAAIKRLRRSHNAESRFSTLTAANTVRQSGVDFKLQKSSETSEVSAADFVNPDAASLESAIQSPVE